MEQRSHTSTEVIPRYKERRRRLELSQMTCLPPSVHHGLPLSGPKAVCDDCIHICDSLAPGLAPCTLIGWLLVAAAAPCSVDYSKASLMLRR